MAQKNNITLPVDKYICEVEFSENPKIYVRSEGIVLEFNKLMGFKKTGFNSTVVGYKAVSSAKKEEVVANKIATGLLEIGCMNITESEFNQLYNLIKYQTNELLRQSGN